VKLKSDTGGTRPSICGSRITFDLAASTAFASSHHCKDMVSQVDATLAMLYSKTRLKVTFESLVAIVLVNEDIV
jgi:hypothetical protein